MSFGGTWSCQHMWQMVCEDAKHGELWQICLESSDTQTRNGRRIESHGNGSINTSSTSQEGNKEDSNSDWKASEESSEEDVNDHRDKDSQNSRKNNRARKLDDLSWVVLDDEKVCVCLRRRRDCACFCGLDWSRLEIIWEKSRKMPFGKSFFWFFLSFWKCVECSKEHSIFSFQKKGQK